jgi:hypothetical protein
MYIILLKIYLQWIYWTLFFIARCSTIFATEIPEVSHKTTHFDLGDDYEHQNTFAIN